MTDEQDYALKIKEANSRLEEAIDILFQCDAWDESVTRRERKHKTNVAYSEMKTWLWNLDSFEMRSISDNLNIIRVLLVKNICRTMAR